MGKLKDVAIPDDKVVFAPLYRNPRKIWAIGLNYKEHAADISAVLNGEVRAINIIANMVFYLDFLVSFHSQVMTLCPGDVIITGTPGSVQIKSGDNVECRIDRFESLLNPVKDSK